MKINANFKDGKEIGEAVFYNECSGKISVKRFYLNGLLEGKSEDFYGFDNLEKFLIYKNENFVSTEIPKLKPINNFPSNNFNRSFLKNYYYKK